MKRLLIALAAAVAVSAASARVTDKQSFEDANFSPSDYFDVVSSVEDEDESGAVAYNNDEPGFAAPYDFTDFGNKYLSLDTGDATLWRTNEANAAYVDMVMQFNPCAEAPAVSADTKISVYLNSTSNLVVQAGDGSGGVSNYVTSAELVPGTWARITIAAVANGFQVCRNGTALESNGTSTFPSLTGDSTILEVGFSGSGKLDGFVARTTNPFTHPANYVAKVGGDDGEYYETFAAALADGQTAVTINSSAYSFSTQNGGAYDAETNPYVIANVEDLLALMYGGDKTASYVQTANIDMAGVAPYLGIDNFSGVYDGGNFTISNVTLAVAEYTGIFRTVTGTVKNLTVANMGFAAGSTGSFGCAIVGKAGNNATLKNLVAEGEFCSATNATHNTAAIVVLVETTAGNGTVTIDGCVNNADVYGSHHRVGGILAYTRNEGSVFITNCVNNGTLCWSTKGTPENPRGIAGIAACPEGTGTVTIVECANTGSFTVTGATSNELVIAATGDIVGHIYKGTLLENGGNTYRSAANMMGGAEKAATVTACPYAVASAESLTTVKASDLAAGGTYVLLTDVAASETPVFTLAAAGDAIAFNTNGFNFAGTVAVADPSTLVPASETVDSVVTFTAVAGVASVDNVAYASFEEAVAAIKDDEDPDTDDYVTLLADVSTTISANTTLKVKTNSKLFDYKTASEDVLIGFSTVDGVTTYTAREGMAKCDGTWYLTFAEAYAAVKPAGTGNSVMEVKLNSDFTPDISADYNHFYSLTFTDVRDDKTEGLTINLKNAAGTAYMASSRYFFPANATLVLAADWTPWTRGLAEGGTLEIPEGITVTLLDGADVDQAFDYITSLSGSGTIAVSSGVRATCFHDLLYYTGSGLPRRLREASWRGVFEIPGSYDGQLQIAYFGNANSVIRFNGFTTQLAASGHGSVGIDLVGDGLSITGKYDSARTYTIGGAITGAGALTLADDTGSLLLSGDVSGFVGSVTAAGTTSAIIFGSSTTDSGNQIVVDASHSVTNASGATWIATNIIVNGELVANGTVNGTLKGSGTYRANASTAAITADASWKGTYVVGWNPDSSYSGFVINNYGNTNTMIEIAGDANGAFVALPATAATLSDATAPSIAAKVILTANWTINNGWVGADHTTTFASLSGGGNLTVNGASGNTTPILYAITELDNYTGTLGGVRGSFTIGKVNVADQPENGARVVKTAVVNGTVNDNVPLYVGGTDTGKTLTKGADGLYYYDTYTVTYNLDLEGATNAVDNIVSFTSLTPAFTLLDAGCEGYTFNGWTNANGTAVATIAGGATGDVTLYASWTPQSTPSGLDPAAGTTNVTVTAESAVAATNAVVIAVPAGSGADADEYKALFNLVATDLGNGSYDVAIVSIKEEVVEKVEGDVLESLLDSDITAVKVPAGLYYRITPSADLSTWGTGADVASGLSDGSNITVKKPSGSGKGFFKVELRAAPFAD